MKLKSVYLRVDRAITKTAAAVSTITLIGTIGSMTAFVADHWLTGGKYVEMPVAKVAAQAVSRLMFGNVGEMRDYETLDELHAAATGDEPVAMDYKALAKKMKYVDHHAAVRKHKSLITDADQNVKVDHDVATPSVGMKL